MEAPCSATTRVERRRAEPVARRRVAREHGRHADDMGLAPRPTMVYGGDIGDRQEPERDGRHVRPPRPRRRAEHGRGRAGAGGGSLRTGRQERKRSRRAGAIEPLIDLVRRGGMGARSRRRRRWRTWPSTTPTRWRSRGGRSRRWSAGARRGRQGEAAALATLANDDAIAVAIVAAGGIRRSPGAQRQRRCQGAAAEALLAAINADNAAAIARWAPSRR